MLGLLSLKKNIESKIKEEIRREDFEKFSSYLNLLTFGKKEMVLKQGEKAEYIYYVDTGLLYSYQEDEKAELHTIQIALEGYWIADLYGFFGENKAILNIEALEETQVYALKRCDFEGAIKNVPQFERFFRILLQNAYIQSQKRITKTLTDDAESRYLDLVKNNPDLIQRVPQYILASYLGIKAQSLSRIRQNLYK